MGGNIKKRRSLTSSPLFCSNHSNEDESKNTMTKFTFHFQQHLINQITNDRSVLAKKLNRHARRYSLSFLPTTKLLEDESQPCVETKNRKRLAPRATIGLEKVNNIITTSKEMVKLLNHILTTDSNHNNRPTSTSLISALNRELDRAQSHIEILIQEQRSNGTVDFLEVKEQDRIRGAVKSVARELEVEKKLRKQSERLNKKLGVELKKSKFDLSEAIKDSESEKRAREILEQICEELTMGIEEDKAEIEELKKESEIIREEVKNEREMLQIANILREERVQMKLSEAKYEYETKHAKVNKLKIDLEELLKAENDQKPPVDCLKMTLRGLLPYKSKDNDKGKVVIAEDPPNYDNTTVSLEKYNSDCIELEFNTKCDEEDASNGIMNENFIGLPSYAEMKEYEDEMERYKMIKDLRDHIVSGSGLASSQGFVMLQEAT